jgi:hypothetical protein
MAGMGPSKWSTSKRLKGESDVSSELCNRIVIVFPVLEPILVEHRRDHGQTLAHLFMADVARWYVEQIRRGAPERAAALSAWLDDAYPMQSDFERNVIDVSFLENLPWPPDPDAEAVAATLGPELRRTLRAMQEWRPSNVPAAQPPLNDQGQSPWHGLSQAIVSEIEASSPERRGRIALAVATEALRSLSSRQPELDSAAAEMGSGRHAAETRRMVEVVAERLDAHYLDLYDEEKPGGRTPGWEGAFRAARAAAALSFALLGDAEAAAYEALHALDRDEARVARIVLATP